MMKIGSLILSSFIASAIAAPAIVWKEKDAGSSSSVVHKSEPLIVNEFIDEFKNDSPTDNNDDNNNQVVSAVIFLVGRDNNGDEALTSLTRSGSLPNISSKYDDAHTIHHHVWGIDGANKVVRTARDEDRKTRVLDLSLTEFNNKLSTHEEEHGSEEAVKEAEIAQDGIVTPTQRGGDQVLERSDIVIVQVSPNTDSKIIDDVVVRAINHDLFKSVVLTAVRGQTEVKHEINMMNRRKLMNPKQQQKQQSAAAGQRRRLDEEEEEEEQDEENENNNNNEDKEGVYYVHMTPNIFAGILFMFFFIMVAIVGFNCMGQISNSDVYVSKMPSVGREA